MTSACIQLWPGLNTFNAFLKFRSNKVAGFKHRLLKCNFAQSQIKFIGQMKRSTSNCLDKRHVWRIWPMRWRPSSCRWTTSIRRPETRFNSGSNASHPKNRIYSLLTTVTDNERRKGREERCRDVMQGVCQLLPENILRRLRAVCVETSRSWTQAATKRIKYVAELKDQNPVNSEVMNLWIMKVLISKSVCI